MNPAAIQTEAIGVLNQMTGNNPSLSQDLIDSLGSIHYGAGQTPSRLPEVWPLRLLEKESGYGFLCKTRGNGISIYLKNDRTFQVLENTNKQQQQPITTMPDGIICHFPSTIFPLVWEVDKFENPKQLPQPFDEDRLKRFALLMLIHLVGTCTSCRRPYNWLNPQALNQDQLRVLINQFHENQLDYMKDVVYPFNLRPALILNHYTNNDHPGVPEALKALIKWIRA